MSELTIHLLGQFRVLLDNQVITNFAYDKVRALLAYLIIEKQHPHRREKLATLFWPNKSESIARTNLRRALVDLRNAIDDYTAEPPYLLITRQDIQFNPSSEVDIDCYHFDQLVETGCNYEKDCAECKIALDLYHGKFLEGFTIPGSIAFDEWLRMIQEQYERKIVNLLHQMIHYYDQQSDYESALPYAWRLTEIVPWHENARRQLMRLLNATGDREEAIHQYEELVKILNIELGIEPEEETVRLMQESKAENPSPVILEDLPDLLISSSGRTLQQRELFVSRIRELTRLHQKLQTVIEHNTGTVTFISGEAGSGKTWLGREFILQAQENHKTLVTAVGICNAYTGIGDPYHPFVEILSQMCGDFEQQLRAHTISREYALRLWETKDTTAKTILNYGRGLIESIVPGYVLLNEENFSRSTSQKWYQKLRDTVLTQREDSPSLNFPLIASQISAVLHQIAKAKPLLLAIDDLQWADTNTINLLMHLGKHLAGSPIMILGTFRPEEVFSSKNDHPHLLHSAFNEFQREYGDIYIRLDEKSGREFINDYLSSEPNDLTKNFQNHLFKITNGHALFVCEILHAFQENGILIKNDTGQWIESGQQTIEKIPPKIEGILAQRIQRLTPKVQEYLKIGSVEGDTFTSEVISATTGDRPEIVQKNMIGVTQHNHRLIEMRNTFESQRNGARAYRFRHGLYQKYLYDKMDPSERSYLHEKVGTALEASLEDRVGVHANQLARHFRLAGLYEKAIWYYLLAGERAERMTGYKEAIHLYENALELNQQLSASAEKDQQELLIQIRIGLAYQAIMGFGHEEVGKAYERAWELCQFLEADEHRLNILMILTSFATYRGQYDRYFEIDEQRKKIYEEIDIDPHFMQLRRGWANGFIDMRFGRFINAAKNFQKAANAYHQTKESGSEATGMEAGIYIHGWGALVNCILGEFQTTIDHLESIKKILETKDNLNFITSGWMFLAWGYIYLQEYEKAETYLNDLIKTAVAEFYLFYEAIGRYLKGIILIHQEDFLQATKELAKSIQMILMTGAMADLDMYYLAYARALLGSGLLEETRNTLSEVITNQEITGEKNYLALTALFQGEYLLVENKKTEAELHFKKSIEIAQEQSAKLFELFAIETLSRLRHQQGKTKQARESLSDMIAKFDGQPDVGILREARQLLEILIEHPAV